MIETFQMVEERREGLADDLAAFGVGGSFLLDEWPERRETSAGANKVREETLDLLITHELCTQIVRVFVQGASSCCFNQGIRQHLGSLGDGLGKLVFVYHLVYPAMLETSGLQAREFGCWSFRHAPSADPLPPASYHGGRKGTTDPTRGAVRHASRRNPNGASTLLFSAAAIQPEVSPGAVAHHKPRRQTPDRTVLPYRSARATPARSTRRGGPASRSAARCTASPRACR